MADFQISLPQAAGDFVQEQVAAGLYRTPSEMVASLVEQARKRSAAERLMSMVQEGIDSGPPIEATPEWRRQFREEMLARIPPDAPE